MSQAKYIKKENIVNWQSRLCGVCLTIIEGDYHIDHIIPLSKGGDHCTDNLQLTHGVCNQTKFVAIL